jgi:hypothetical protein
MAQGVVDGDAAAACGAILEYLLPPDRLGVLRRLLGPALGRLMIARYKTVPRNDLLTEARAEVAPALIPGCSLIWYAGKGHMRTAASGQVAADVLAFAARG